MSWFKKKEIEQQTKYLSGSLKSEPFIGILAEELNKYEFKRLIRLCRDLIKEGHRNLYVHIWINYHKKRIFFKDLDIPSVEERDPYESYYDPQLVGDYFLSGDDTVSKRRERK